MSNTVTKPPRAAFNKLLLNETRLAFRPPLGLLVGIGLPVLLLIIFGTIPGTTQANKALGGMSYFTVSFPVLIGMSVLLLSVISLPRALVTYREQGILRRLSVTPVPPIWLLAAQVIVNLCLAVAGIAILTTAGIVALGLPLPKDLPGFFIGCILTITSLFAIALVITSIAKTNGIANAMGGLLLYLLLFFGGLWIPLQLMPHTLREVSNWTPLGASVSGLQSAMQGHFPGAQSLVCLVGYTIVFSYLAVRYFKWE